MFSSVVNLFAYSIFFSFFPFFLFLSPPHLSPYFLFSLFVSIFFLSFFSVSFFFSFKNCHGWLCSSSTFGLHFYTNITHFSMNLLCALYGCLSSSFTWFHISKLMASHGYYGNPLPLLLPPVMVKYMVDSPVGWLAGSTFTWSVVTVVWIGVLNPPLDPGKMTTIVELECQPQKDDLPTVF